MVHLIPDAVSYCHMRHLAVEILHRRISVWRIVRPLCGFDGGENSPDDKREHGNACCTLKDVSHAVILDSG